MTGPARRQHRQHRQHRPNPSDPPVCRLWLRYAKRGRLRFTSHRDIARIFERALRRAGMPMAYSQGFSPHPKISWIGAAPTGAASEAEYLEIALVARPDPEVVRLELTAALPDGLVVTGARPAAPDGLAGRIDGARWRIELPGVPGQTLRTAVDRLLRAREARIERLTKNGTRTLDVRAVLVTANTADAPDGSPGTTGSASCGTLTVVVLQGSPAVRPDDVVSALDVVAGLRPPVPARATRTAQGRIDGDGTLVDPFDRAAVAG